MKHTKRSYLPFAVSAILMWVALYIIFPWYRYYIDPDGTSYLTISQRYADGDWRTAINGLWSPWACWLTALLIKAGLAAIPASVVVNAAGATGFLFISQSFFVRFGVNVLYRWFYCLSLVVFLCFAVFWQSFDDLWGCFFMLCVLRIVVSQNFTARPLYWVSAGVLGALAFFAKAYSLPYFVLSFGACAAVLARRWGLWLRIMFVALPVMLICCFPWLYLLHDKYGIWTTSTAGALNMSWYLVGHPEWKEGIDLLLPPAHPTSVYYWEDPWYANGHLSHYWDSWKLAGMQVLRLGYNFVMLVICMMQLSIFFPAVAVFIVFRLLLRFRALSSGARCLYLFFIILPAGYVMVHLESRYLWLMVPIVMIVVSQAVSLLSPNQQTRKLLAGAFALSMLAYPLWQLRAMFNEGKAEYLFAQQLSAAGIKDAAIMSNLHPRLLSKIMYFSGNHFYVINNQLPHKREDKAANTARLVADARRRNVTYYLHSPIAHGKLHNPGFDMIFYENLRDSTSTVSLEKVMHDPTSGYTLYRLPQ